MRGKRRKALRREFLGRFGRKPENAKWERVAIEAEGKPTVVVWKITESEWRKLKNFQ